MNERKRPPREQLGNGDSAAGLFAEDEETGGSVRVTNGPYGGELPVGNSTVGEIRRRFSDRFDIDPNSQAILDGNAVSDETIVRTGQSLMFAREAGEKGGGGC